MPTYCSGYCRLGCYPLMFALCSITTCVITYSISVSNGHVYPFFPTISDTGGTKPESNVFSLLLNCCGCLGVIVSLIRYYQFRYISEDNEEWYVNLIWFNRVALLFGLLSCLGILVVAAFQDRGVSGEEHGIGALFAFGCGIIYCFLQSYLTYKMFERGINTQCLLMLRILIAVLALGFFVSNQVCANFSGMERRNHPRENCTIPHWRPECPGFTYNVASTASEWAMAFSLFSFFVTYYGEFNKVRMYFNFKRHESTILIPAYTPTDSLNSYG